MATITFGKSGNRPYCTLSVTQKSQDTGGNKTTVSYSLKLHRPYSISSSQSKSWSCTINGTKHSGSGTIGGSGDKTLLSGTQTISHNADGTKSISFSGSCKLDITFSGTKLGTISGSGSMTLTKIPRYFSSLSCKVNSATETNVTIGWNTAETCDGVWATYDGSDHYINNPNSTSGSFNISMNANTSKSVYLKLRRKDSQLKSNTNTVTAKTYDYPNCVSGTDFDIGSALKLDFYNPLKRNIDVKLYAFDGTLLNHPTTTGTVLNGFNDAATVDKMYQTIPNAKSGTYYVDVSYSGTTKRYSANKQYRAVAAPVFADVSVIDTKTYTGVTKTDTELVQGISDLRALIGSVSAQKYSKLTKVEITYGAFSESRSYTDSTSDTDVAFDIGTANGTSATLKATDSRGLTKEMIINISFANFNLPTINIEAERGNYDSVYNTWTSDDAKGKYAKVNLTGTIDSRLAIDSSRSTITIDDTTVSVNSFGEKYLGGNLSFTRGYDITAIVYDTLGRFVQISGEISSGMRIFSVINGEGIAFGGMAEKGKFKIYPNLELDTAYTPIIEHMYQLLQGAVYMDDTDVDMLRELIEEDINRMKGV